MRKELTKEAELEDSQKSDVVEKIEDSTQTKEEILTAAEILDVAEGNLLRALNAIRMLR